MLNQHFQNNKPVAIGADHAGYDYKQVIIPYLQEMGWQVMDKGTDGNKSVDYPDYAHPVAAAVENNEAACGILICGSGNGVCITANKHKGVRAALAWNKEVTELARQHNNANVLCLPARFISIEEAKNMVQAFLTTAFEGGRHERRVEKI